METFIRRHFWTLAAVILLFATLVGAGMALDGGIKVEEAQMHSTLRVKLPDSQVVHETRWALTPREAPAPATPPPGTASPLHEVGQEHAYELSVADLDAALGSRDDLIRQARVVPSFRNGTPRGLKLFRIQPGSLLEKLGIQDGDVVQRINGVTLDSPESVLEAYSRLREARLIRVELEREGLPIQRVYAVK